MGTVAAVVLVLSITAVTTWVAMQAFTSLFSLVAAATLGVLTGISAAAYAWFVRPHRYKLMFVVAVGATSLLSPLVAFGVILVLRQAAEGIAESPVH